MKDSLNSLGLLLFHLRDKVYYSIGRRIEPIRDMSPKTLTKAPLLMNLNTDPLNLTKSITFLVYKLYVLDGCSRSQGTLSLLGFRTYIAPITKNVLVFSSFLLDVKPPE